MERIAKFYERLGLCADTKTEYTYEFIKNLQYSCVTVIPYENLDLVVGRLLKLDVDSLYEKIVTNGRGGYCFEVNALMAWALKSLGFEVKNHLARYLRGEESIPERRHRVLSVKCDEGIFMCDAGVGQSAPRHPVKIEAGLVQEQFGETYKFEYDEKFGWILYDLYKGEWRKFISFTEEEQYEIDFEQASFFVERHPGSKFNKFPIVAIKTADGRKTLNDREYKVFGKNGIECIEQDISDERMAQLLENEFNINLSTLK